MTPKQQKHLSKFLSLVLRHRPEMIGLTLDDAGWVPVADVLTGFAQANKSMDRDQLDEIVRTSDKQRFALSEDGTRIRANQGHSVPVDLGYQTASPPAVLLHGTVDRFLDAIRADGLKPMNRHHVHLSADHATAQSVGGRRGKPVLLKIDAAGMVAAGHDFWVTANAVWLAAAVPAEFISFPE